MLKINKSKISYKSLSEIFSAANFRRIMKEDGHSSIELKIKNNLVNFEKRSYSDILNFTYKELEHNYRNEYVYKNALLNEKILKSYGFRSTTVLNEFKIGKSIADFVLLNGEAKIFEIKTDLDGFDKLSKQILDYQKFANKVYIVVSSKNINKITNLYKTTPVGIIEYTTTKKLKTVKEAENYNFSFNHSIIFKTLRKQEYLEIVTDYFGFVPDVPNTQIFKKCFELTESINILEFQKLAFNKIKERKLRCPEIIESEEIPNELKHICYTLNPTNNEYNKLLTFLNTTI